MTAEQNKTLLRQALTEVLDGGNLERADDLVAPDAVNHSFPPGVSGTGPDGLKATAAWLGQTFSDRETRIDDMFAEGDKVVARVTFTGAQTGELMGLPPTGKRFSVTEIHICRVADGKIAEHWGVVDNLSMLQQLGAMPSTADAQTV